MFMFSGKFIWVPMYIAFLVSFWRAFTWRIAVVWILAVVVAVALSDQLCATFIRPYFERLRPSNLANPVSQFVHIVQDYRGGSYGFPSCHAANSFALATVMACIWRGTRLKWFIFLWAFVNSYSRIYLGVHYPGDLLVGGIIGSIIGLSVFFLARMIVWKIVDGDMYKSRAKLYYLRLNDWLVPYRSIDVAVIVGVLTFVSILVIAAG